MSPSHGDAINGLDTEIVRLAKTGDQEAFTLLFQHYSRGVYGYLVGLVGNDEDAHDLTQNTFFKIWKKLPTLNDDSSFKPWLYTVARNLAFDFFRKEKKISNESYEHLPEHINVLITQNLEDGIAQAELIRLALTELPTKHRECLLLQVQGGFSNEEIAKLMHLTKESVSVYIYTARKQVRQVYYQLIHEQNNSEKRRSD